MSLWKSFVSMNLLLAVVACDMEQDDCADAGGRWNDIVDECECTYEDRGTFNINPTPEELALCSKTQNTNECSCTDKCN